MKTYPLNDAVLMTAGSFSGFGNRLPRSPSSKYVRIFQNKGFLQRLSIMTIRLYRLYLQRECSPFEVLTTERRRESFYKSLAILTGLI